MVQLERRRGLLFSVIILGAIVSGSVYYYVRDYWNIEAKVKSRLIFSAYVSVNLSCTTTILAIVSDILPQKLIIYDLANTQPL